VQPDLSRCGGLSTAVPLAVLARERGVELVTHSWLTDLLHSYSLHFLSSLPQATWVEFNVAQSALSSGATRSHLQLVDGCVAVPTGVGIGADVDSEFIAAHHITAS
jgi:L-alanine-DL-glutamate epimerase-like enolase superfamily enzyme